MLQFLDEQYFGSAPRDDRNSQREQRRHRTIRMGNVKSGIGQWQINREIGKSVIGGSSTPGVGIEYPSGRTMSLRPALAIALGVLGSCAAPETRLDMNQIADRYVRLVLKVGQHDENFVDAYYGDPARKPAGAPAPLDPDVAI